MITETTPMRLYIFCCLLFSFFFVATVKAQETNEHLSEAYLMANIKSFNTNGTVKCEMICYVNTNEENLPPITFQVNRANNSEESFLAVIDLDEDCGSNESVVIKKKEQGFEIHFGQVEVHKDFQARLIIEENTYAEVYDLDLIGYQHQATKVN